MMARGMIDTRSMSIRPKQAAEGYLSFTLSTVESIQYVTYDAVASVPHITSQYIPSDLERKPRSPKPKASHSRPIHAHHALTLPLRLRHRLHAQIASERTRTRRAVQAAEQTRSSQQGAGSKVAESMCRSMSVVGRIC